MEVNLGYKYLLIPTKKQAKLLYHHLFTYNQTWNILLNYSETEHEEFSNVLNNLGYEVKDLNSKLDNLLCIDRYIVVDGVTYGFQIKPESYLNGINQTEIKEHFFKMFNVVKSNKKVNIFVVVKKNDKFMVLTLKNGILIFQPIEKWLDRYLSRKLNSSQLNSNSIKIFEQIVEKKLN
jgi:transposase